MAPSFLSLPREMRNMVYEIALPNPRDLIIQSGRVIHPIQRTCWQLDDELLSTMAKQAKTFTTDVVCLEIVNLDFGCSLATLRRMEHLPAIIMIHITMDCTQLPSRGSRGRGGWQAWLEFMVQHQDGELTTMIKMDFPGYPYDSAARELAHRTVEEFRTLRVRIPGWTEAPAESSRQTGVASVLRSIRQSTDDTAVIENRKFKDALILHLKDTLVQHSISVKKFLLQDKDAGNAFDAHVVAMQTHLFPKRDGFMQNAVETASMQDNATETHFDAHIVATQKQTKKFSTQAKSTKTLRRHLKHVEKPEMQEKATEGTFDAHVVAMREYLKRGGSLQK